MWPSSMTKLSIFDSSPPLNNLPSSLTQLFLSKGFNQPLDHLPASLKELTIDSIHYNQPLDNLPDSLIRLFIISEKFNLQINRLPKKLCLCWLHCEKFNSQIISAPDSLSKLHICSEAYCQPLIELPKKLKSLSIPCWEPLPLGAFPTALGNLHLSHFNFSVDHFPDTLANLGLGNQFNFPISHLPQNLASLNVGDSFNHPLNGVLPPKLDSLFLGKNFNADISTPPSCKYLSIELPELVSRNVLRDIPESVKELNIQVQFPLVCLICKLRPARCGKVLS